MFNSILPRKAKACKGSVCPIVGRVARESSPGSYLDRLPAPCVAGIPLRRQDVSICQVLSMFVYGYRGNMRAM